MCWNPHTAGEPCPYSYVCRSLMGEGAPRAGLPVQIPTGGGISCFLPREGASLGRGRGAAPLPDLRW